MNAADADFDAERPPMGFGGFFIFCVALVTSWLAVWIAYRAFVAVLHL